MRAISEMYRQSGGTAWEHYCRECKQFRTVKKHSYCLKHPEKEREWKGTYVACKFFE